MPLEILRTFDLGFSRGIFSCPKNPPDGVSDMSLLNDYLPLDQAAEECHKHPRTLHRWAKERGIAVLYLGRTPWIHVPTFREAMLQAQAKDDAKEA
jgi:hypothetical protein